MGRNIDDSTVGLRQYREMQACSFVVETNWLRKLYFNDLSILEERKLLSSFLDIIKSYIYTQKWTSTRTEKEVFKVATSIKC
jgi:hypothetical protein